MTPRRVAVIGGGIAGASATWALAADGHDVTLLEREPELGTHATGRSAATLSETSGLRPVCALARASRPFLETPPDGFVEHPLTAPRGLLWIGRAPGAGRTGDGDDGLSGESAGDAVVDDGPALDAIAALAASGVSPSARRVDAAAVAALVPELRPAAIGAGGVWEPDARAVDVAALLGAYARGARVAGATIELGAEIEAIERRPSGWRIAWRRRDGEPVTIDVDVVVDAAGAWGDEVAAMAGVERLGLRPLRRTACLVPAGDEVKEWPLVMDVAGRCYFEPESGGLLLSPADEQPSDPVDARAEVEDVAWALEMLAETTTLDIRHVRREWAGLRTFTADRIPAVGWDAEAPGWMWLVGQGGAGIKIAPALAAIVAALAGDHPWPADVTALGVTPTDLGPSRLR